MVLYMWHVSLDGDLGRISVRCVQKCVASWPLAWKIEDIWMPSTSVLSCLPTETWVALFWKKTLTLLVEASTLLLLTVPWGGGSCSPPCLVGSFLESQMLTSAAVHLSHAPILWVTFGRASTVKGRKKSQTASGQYNFGVVNGSGVAQSRLPW